MNNDSKKRRQYVQLELFPDYRATQGGGASQ